ncbi:unnamed protein product [Moneuplotes crassus]|uniref:Uncharacterized protein n=1 Tax=Euplotes crassus TaxID=5936 RepID=A0AAD2CZH8_EUPCR|nr:unnamed protein product [Moneuplotes crassus]
MLLCLLILSSLKSSSISFQKSDEFKRGVLQSKKHIQWLVMPEEFFITYFCCRVMFSEDGLMISS